MKRQKICIIGGSLTGLVTAISLSKFNCDVDLITADKKQRYNSIGTIAITPSSLDFLNKLNISKSLKKLAWPSLKMKLYTEIKNKKFSEIFELKNDNKKEVLYMLENKKIIKLMIDKIKKTKSITLKSGEKVLGISNFGSLKSVKIKNKNSKYNLVIICSGKNSVLVNELFNENLIYNSYQEESIITTLKHSRIKNNVARQIFLDGEILALLPISNNQTSVVWSIKKKHIVRNELLLKKKLKSYAKYFFKKIYFVNKIQQRDLNFLVRKKYYKDRILLFGDALHTIHPFAGQGFNMTLRDLACLEKIIQKKISLGLDIGSSNLLSDFSKKAKPRNFAFSVGVDILRNSFSIKNKYFKQLRNKTLKVFNKNDFIKGILFSIANKGFKF